jgi:hypothetical protein
MIAEASCLAASVRRAAVEDSCHSAVSWWPKASYSRACKSVSILSAS